MNNTLAQHWWAIALRGVFAIIFGIIALLIPGATIAALVILFAAYMLVDGVLDLIAGIRAARRDRQWGLLVLEGIADLAAGAIAILWPLITVLAFVWILGAWGIVSGGLLCAAAFRLHAAHGRGWMLLGGVLSVIWGILLLIWPLVGAVVLTWWLGAYALVFGISLIVLAFRLRRARHDLPSGALPHGV